MANENENTGIEEIFDEVEDRDEDLGFEDEPRAELDAEEAESALAGLRRTLLAIPDSEVRPFRVSVTKAVGMGLSYAQAYAEDRALFQRTFTIEAFDPLRYDDLGDRAKAFWRADIQMRQELDVDGPLSPMIEEAEPLRLKLMKAAIYLWSEDPDLGDVVESIRKGRGRSDHADDLGRLAALLDERWDEVEDKCGVTREDIARAEKLGAGMLELLSPARVEIVDEVRDLRNRAAEHLRRGIEGIHDAASYLFRNDAAKLERYPSLFVHGKRKRSNGGGATEDAPDSDVGAPAVPAASPEPSRQDPAIQSGKVGAIA